MTGKNEQHSALNFENFLGQCSQAAILDIGYGVSPHSLYSPHLETAVLAFV